MGCSRLASLLLTALALWAAPLSAQTTNWSVLGWNNLGMHCMDSDYGVFSILPPYNTIHAQMVGRSGGRATLVTNASGYTVSYRAVGDSSGSTNRTSIDKSDFWDHVLAFFGANLAPDQGLAGSDMPGTNNVPQPMPPEAASAWFAAYGVPITPYDDAQRKNAYPLMQLQAYTNGAPVASNNIVLPVSDEMDCRSCHGSGRQSSAQPAAGWVWDPNPERDYRLNILRRHDEQRGTGVVYRAALATNRYESVGLLATVLKTGTPILCAKCHGSEALPGSGLAGIPPLTAAVHGRHAAVKDPDTGVSLDDTANRTACYRCHPGAATRCLRGAMGSAIATNGLPSMHCQSCHGGMSEVGDPGRTGWLQEPTCQSCHSGTATHNNGEIRYTSVYTATGTVREAVDQTFATSSNVPGPGFSLFRFSRGHGRLYCEACHGSTHAEFPSSHRNDNVYSVNHQGHAGVLAECASCHGGVPSTTRGGPHGLHPIGPGWVEGHRGVAESSWDAGECQKCHGATGKGSVLSRAHAVRTLTAFSGAQTTIRRTWRGYQVTCYTCHRGASNHNSPTPIAPPRVQSVFAATGIGQPVTILLAVTDTNVPVLTLATRVVTQPANGTVALEPAATNALYTPFPSFSGTDTFTYAAFNGDLDSNLATATVVVAGGPCAATVSPLSFMFDAAGGVNSATVSTVSGCPWSAVPDHRWLTVVAGTGGDGPGAVLFAVARHTGSVARQGTLTIAGRTVTVTQEAPPASVTNEAAITAIAADPGAPAELDYTSVSNRLLHLEATGDLIEDYWLGLGPARLGTGLPLHEQDPAASNLVRRFYRVRLYP